MNRLNLRPAVVLLAASLAAQTGLPAHAQNYPVKPIRIVTSAAGGGNDYMARIIAQAISGPLGQQVIIENRGGSSVILGEVVVNAPADGYTLLFASSSLWLAPLLQKTPYDPLRDLAPISLVDRSPNILVVHPSLPAHSVKELIALAKARPGEINYSSSGVGTSAHLAGELFKSLTGVKMVHVAYKGSVGSLNGLLSGEVQLSFATTTSVSPHIKAGRLRALAVTTAEPTPLLPGLTTVAAAGVPGYEAASTDGLLAPAKTPAAIITRLNQEVVRALNRPEIKDKFLNTGIDLIAGAPDDFAAAIRIELTRMGKVIRDAGIRAD